MEKITKKIGIGSLSLPLCIIGALFSVSFKNKICYGDIILNFFGLKPWSNGNQGTHYTVFYSLIFIILAFIIGYKFENDLGAKLGRIVPLSIFMFAFLMVIFTFIV